jgi:hypothetical protein
MASVPPHAPALRGADRVAFAPGAYLTDGRRLLCVVSRSDSRDERVGVVLEDCLTFAIEAYTRDQLDTMAFTSVTRHNQRPTRPPCSDDTSSERRGSLVEEPR